MLLLKEQLELPRCPHCSVDSPNLITKAPFNTQPANGGKSRDWRIYCCVRCGGLITAAAPHGQLEISEYYPKTRDVAAELPERSRDFMLQAMNSLHAPAGAVMLAASAVDAMLKAKGYSEGKLYGRINKAIKDSLITKEMGDWAHQVRLDANDQRHADEEAKIPDGEDARRAIEFAAALGDFLFVFPSRVNRGLEESAAPSTAS